MSTHAVRRRSFDILMRVLLQVPSPDTEGQWRSAAVSMWRAFEAAIENPLGRTDVTVGTSEDAPPSAKAWSRAIYADPRDAAAQDTSEIVLSRALLEESTSLEQRLTLLHECIHMRFAFGAHRERWCRIKARWLQIARDDLSPAHPELGRFRRQRNYYAFAILMLPDEIVAEQYLKAAYPAYFGARAEYYLQMRRRSRNSVDSPSAFPSIQPLMIYHELLRLSFYRRLVTAGAVDTELRALEEFATIRLAEVTSPALSRWLGAMVVRLLDVEHDRSLESVENAFDEVFAKLLDLCAEPSDMDAVGDKALTHE